MPGFRCIWSLIGHDQPPRRPGTGTGKMPGLTHFPYALQHHDHFSPGVLPQHNMATAAAMIIHSFVPVHYSFRVHDDVSRPGEREGKSVFTIYHFCTHFGISTFLRKPTFLTHEF